MRTFASAAARDAWFTHPVRGQQCVQLDTGALLIYYGPALGWLPPWNVPWGRVTISQLATFSQIVTATTTPLFPVTFTPVFGRRYEIRFRATVGYAGANDDMRLDLWWTAWSSPGQGEVGSTFTLANTDQSPKKAVVEYVRQFDEGTSPFVGQHEVGIQAFYFYNTLLASGALSITIFDGLFGLDSGDETSLEVVDTGPVSGPPT